jgi:hypothetical protein
VEVVRREAHRIGPYALKTGAGWVYDVGPSSNLANAARGDHSRCSSTRPVRTSGPATLTPPKVRSYVLEGARSPSAAAITSSM